MIVCLYLIMGQTIKEEIEYLEKEIRYHEGYLKRNWLTPEGYKKWYKRKRSLLGKLKRRKKPKHLNTMYDFIYIENNE